MLTFEWDSQKEKRNIDKHGVSFVEAASAFRDLLSITIDDPLHSNHYEERMVLVGMSHLDRLVVVVHTERGDNIRIISARKATKRERKDYEGKQ